MKDIIKNTKCFLFDLDGTIYLEDKLIDGVLEVLSGIKQTGKTYKFLTNNSSKSRNEYLLKLQKLGIECYLEDIITSNTVTIDYLKSEFFSKKVYLMATEKVEAEYKKAGINVAKEDFEITVLTYDTSLTYNKLAKAVSLINRGAVYIATHPDLTCPSKDGFLPDLGSLIECIYASTNRRPDIICGKPHSLMGKYIEKNYGFKPYEIAMVGDRLYTDMKFALNCGFKSILVLSGEAKKEMIIEKYDWVIDSIKDLFS